MIRTRGNAVCQLPHLRGIHAGAHDFVSNQARPALGEGAGFIQRHMRKLARLFQIHAAFDQNTAPRCRRQPAHHRHGCGDHQRARAGNHQNDQRLVDGHKPRPACQPRPQQRHTQRKGKHGRRVHGGKPIDKTLDRCARALRLLHCMDDARQHRIAGRHGHLKLQRGVLIDGAGKYLIPRGFFHRHALAGDRCLVDGAVTCQHPAIQCQTLARLDANNRPPGNVLHRHAAPCAIGLAHFGHGRRQIQQSFNGMAGAIHRARLDPFRQRIQRHHHGRLGPLPDDKSTGHGHRHQGGNAELAAQQQSQPLAVHAKARQRNGHAGQCHAQHIPRHGFWCQKMHHLST